MNIQVVGYSIIKNRETGAIKSIVVHGINLERKCYNGEGYEVVYQRRLNNTNVGLFIPAKYAPFFNKDIIGKKIHVSFNMNGYVDEFELLK